MDLFRVAVGEQFVSGGPDPYAGGGGFRPHREEDRRVVQRRGVAVEFLVLLIETGRPVAPAFRLRDRHVIEKAEWQRRAEVLREAFVKLLVRQRDECFHSFRRHCIDPRSVTQSVENHHFPVAFRDVPPDRLVGERGAGRFETQVHALPRFEVHRHRGLDHAVLPVLVQFSREFELRVGLGALHVPRFLIETLHAQVGEAFPHFAAGGPGGEVHVVVEDDFLAAFLGLAEDLAEVLEVAVGQVARLGRDLTAKRQEREAAKTVFGPFFEELVDQIVGERPVRVPER